MKDGADRFAARYPQVWHVIEAEGAGPWLAATGLLPAATLLQQSGDADDGSNRDDFRLLSFADGRVAVLRPQLMPDRWLLPTLAGAYAGRPAGWRMLVNAHVFFWIDPRRRDAFLLACQRLRARSRVARATQPPLMLTLQTAALLRRHAGAAFFTRFNSGSTVRGGARARRDETTFRPIAGYSGGAAAELAIRGPVALSPP